MVTLEEAFKKIESYLARATDHPLIIDSQNRNDLQSIKSRFKLGNNQFISIDCFTTPEGAIRKEDVLRKIRDSGSNLFITGLAPTYMLYGMEELRSILDEFIHHETGKHVVILTYQCRAYFDRSDPRVKKRYCIVDGDSDQFPKIVFIRGSIDIGNVFDGLNHMEEVVEINYAPSCYIKTTKTAEDFETSVYRISELNSAYPLLAPTFPEKSGIEETFGTPEQWNYAYQQFQKTKTWEFTFDSKFGDHDQLLEHLQSLHDFSDDESWLLLLGLKIYCASTGYLANAVQASSSISELIEHLYTDILKIEPTSPDYIISYQTRKRIVGKISDDVALRVFCDQLLTDQYESIYYLTDNTIFEKERIFQIIDANKESLDEENLINILKLVYPDLGHYLSPYSFRSGFLTSYFTQYKFLKVTNKITENFYNMVNDQSIKHEFFKLLDTRASIIDSIDKHSTQLFFIDALGVEYISLILEECKRLGMSANVHIGRCELPSITSRNKEFLNQFRESDIVSPKELDEMKHHGHLDQNYQHTKLPIHLIDEIEIVKKYLEDIKTTLSRGKYKKVIIASDHGASRLAVINEHESLIQMQTKGIHSGRCCPKTEIDNKPDDVVDAEDFWAIANYDRFKGSRKADVEVHGGATLEEVSVPIIELELSSSKVALRIKSDEQGIQTTTPVIQVSFRKKASFILISSSELENPYVSIGGQIYDAALIKDRTYRVVVPDLKKEGVYSVDVYSSGSKIAESLSIRIEKESGGERELL